MKRIILTLTFLVAFLVLLSVGASALTGDIDNDGEITAWDAKTALSFSLGIASPTSEQENTADIVRDGFVNIDDARKLLKIAAGISQNEGHNYTPWETLDYSTCKYHGKAKCECTHCGKVINRELPYKIHTVGTCTVCKRKFTLETALSGNTVLFGEYSNEVIDRLGTPKENLKNNGKPILIYAEEDILNVLMFDGNNKLCALYTTDKSAVFKDTKKGIKDFNMAYDEVEDLNGIDYLKYTDDLSPAHTVYAMLVKATDSAVVGFSEDNYRAFETVDYYLINQERAMNKMAPIKRSDELSNIARSFSQYMSDNSFFGNLDYKKRKDLNSLFNSEAIGTEYSFSETNWANQPNVFKANNGFYNDASPRSYMLDKKYTLIGIGFYCDLKAEKFLVCGTHDFLYCNGTFT